MFNSNYDPRLQKQPDVKLPKIDLFAIVSWIAIITSLYFYVKTTELDYVIVAFLFAISRELSILSERVTGFLQGLTMIQWSPDHNNFKDKKGGTNVNNDIQSWKKENNW